MMTSSNMKTTSLYQEDLKYEDDLNKKEDLKCKDNLKFEDNLKYEEGLRYEDDQIKCIKPIFKATKSNSLAKLTNPNYVSQSKQTRI